MPHQVTEALPKLRAVSDEMREYKLLLQLMLGAVEARLGPTSGLVQHTVFISHAPPSLPVQLQQTEESPCQTLKHSLLARKYAVDIERGFDFDSTFNGVSSAAVVVVVLDETYRTRFECRAELQFVIDSRIDIIYCREHLGWKPTGIRILC